MLYDKARIFIQGGRGGDGVTSFRREAHVPKGGPDGGDGGRGGAVVLLCDDSLRDLQAFKRKAHYKAARARHGEGAQRTGADGGDLIVRVPPGTIVRGLDGAIHDLVTPGHRVVVARGGGGGRGNRHFRGSTHQAPRFHEKGLAGEEGWIELQLKLLADVGLVGLPNAGKSSLISRLTRAAPKVADYPFTTLEPHLGTLDGADRQLIIADIPGLIEGASEGAGLGHEFLAHVERTRLLVHVLDLAPLDGSDPAENHAVIERELAAHDPRLAALPRILALSKADLVPPDVAAAARERWSARLNTEVGPREEWEPEPARVPVIVTSSATREGLNELAAELLRRVPLEAPREQLAEAGQLAEHQVFRPGPSRGWAVDAVGEGVFRVFGEQVDRLIARHDLENDDALAHIEHRLKRMGVVRALEDAGFEPGDDVEIGGVVFELDPDSLPRRMARFVIKLGTSVVAQPTGEPRADVLAGVCAAVAERHRAGDELVLVSSGAIAVGMRIMGLGARPSSIEDLQAASAVGQGRLYRQWDDLLSAEGVGSAQVLLTFFDMSARTHYLNARQTLRRLLDWNVVPVINENDTTTTDEISFGDNDFLAAQVAILVGADRLLLLTDIDGLYTADPRRDEAAEIVRAVSDFEGLSALSIGHSTSPLGSGGMRSKVVAAEMASAAGIPSVIANGVRPGALAAALDGDAQEGTHFAAREARYSSFKLWLKYAKPAHGTVVVDAGASRALRDGGTSLLPVGITEVRGEFDAGDAVNIAEGAVILGKGICNYSAAELRRVAGKRTRDVQEILPRATEEAVHRDYFVLA